MNSLNLLTPYNNYPKLSFKSNVLKDTEVNNDAHNTKSKYKKQLATLTLATVGFFIPINTNAKQTSNKDNSSHKTEIITTTSEGLDNKINYVVVSNQYNKLNKFRKELKKIGKETGFEIIFLDTENKWTQDPVIECSDGNLYYTAGEIPLDSIHNIIINPRENISQWWQGVVSKKDASDEYLNLMFNYPQKKYKCASYLEGGNVLTTRKKDGTPSAVIGEESLKYSKFSIEYYKNGHDSEKAKIALLNETEAEIENTKKQIASDLGLENKNITYIPQFDFHIDMYYHPLHDGEIAVPDYEEAIKILKENEISGMEDTTKQNLIEELEILNKKVKPYTQKTEEILTNDGYELKHIPCFSTISEHTAKKVPDINYANGFGGEAKDGSSFFVTNKSDYPELDEIVATYYNKAGVDKVYFLPIGNCLNLGGGTGCLTLPLSTNKKIR